jgi:putative ABC transport system permease protein
MFFHLLTVVPPVMLACFGVLIVLLFLIGKVPLSYNVRNLTVRWVTTSLTALAFTLIVGLLILLLAFVNGMSRLTENSGRIENILVLGDGSTDEIFSNLGYGDIKRIELRDEVARTDEGKPLASWEVYVVVNQPIPVHRCPTCGKEFDLDPKRKSPSIPPHERKVRSWFWPLLPDHDEACAVGRQRRFIQVRGVEDPEITSRVHGLPLHEGGQWFTKAGVRPIPGDTTGRQANECVIGEGLARELGPDQGKKSLEAGDFFELGPRTWVVTGILNSPGSTFDSEVWGKFSTVCDQFGKSTYTTTVLRVANGANQWEFAKDLRENFKTPAVSAKVEKEYYEGLNTTNEQFLVAIMVVGFVMAIGGMFGIMNTMFAAISQRTKDIGVLRILGYTGPQVLVSFFLESLILALVGGLLGCALGSLSHGWSASSVVSSGPGGGRFVVLRMIIDSRILMSGLAFSLFMGAIGGLFPALSALRLKPLDAVR